MRLALCRSQAWLARRVARLLATLLLLASPSAAQSPPGSVERARDALLSSEAAMDIGDDADPGIVRFEQLRASLAGRFDAVRAYDADAARMSGDDRKALQSRALQMRLGSVDSLGDMVDIVADLEKRGVDATLHRAQLVAFLPGMGDSIRREFETLEGALTEARAAGPGGESEARRLEAEQDRVLEAAMRHVVWLEQFQLPSEPQRTWAQGAAARRARLLSGRVQLAATRLLDAGKLLTERPDDAELIAQVARQRSTLQDSTAALRSSVNLLEGSEVDVSGFKQVLVASTGQITTDLLDPSVAGDLISQWTRGALDSIRESAPGVAFQVLIFTFIAFLSWRLSRVVRKVVGRAVEAPHLRLSQLLKRMIVSVASGAVLLLGFLIAFSQLGVEVGPMLAGLGIAGFVVGFALQDTLGNFAAGVMILVYRPYDVGDLIECSGGVFGTVSHMNLVSTTILTIDNRTRVVPNGKIWGDVITNVTAQTMRRVDLVFGISYADEIPKAERVLESILAEHSLVLKEPEFVVRVHELGDSSVNFVVRPWVARDDYWQVYWDVTREVKLRFDREGISIPFPQRDVHFFPTSAVPSQDAAGSN
jgi:small conductance mechanosensitive channel